ncbi:NCS1 nucleoside transporter family protein [Mycobacteroides abscessus subsp. abscessus]|nr:NCS1 nucleoside transporter family protein [Mycobacteroides abscessus subsp. abscessus]
MVLEAAGPAAGRLSNDDLAPTTAAQATWRDWARPIT